MAKAPSYLRRSVLRLHRRGVFILQWVAALLLAVILFLAGGWYFLPAWLPTLAHLALPPDVTLILAGRPLWRQGAVTLPAATLSRNGCQWIVAEGLYAGRGGGEWRMGAARASIDTACLTGATAGEGPPLAWSLLDSLPPARVVITRLEIQPWLGAAGELSVIHRGGRTQLRWQNDQLKLALTRQDNRLTIDAFSLDGLAGQPRITASGAMTLSFALAAPPEQGSLHLNLALADGTPLDAKLEWQRTEGVLEITEPRTAISLAHLPWRMVDQDLLITDGRWHWPYATQPLSGQVAAKIAHWRQGMDGVEVSARLNMLTQGLRGRANTVLTVGPGPLPLKDNALDMHLYGLANHGALSLNASIPARLSGPISNPSLVMLPGALLRATGPLSNALNITSARLPLAGTRLSARGISGRLQAILLGNADRNGRFTLHLDGGAQEFLPDKGEWRWRYWGSGDLPLLSSRWNISGRGAWLNETIELSELNSSPDRINYGLVAVERPRLSLLRPLRWRRNELNPEFSGGLQLSAHRIDISHGGYLPTPSLALHMEGVHPQDFQWHGNLQAGDIGPVRLNGRWDGTRWRGQAWWPKQPLRVFQPLLAPSLNATLRDGEFYAQSAFSAAPGQGFLAGGHAVVSGGDVWLEENRLRGLSLALSYRLRDRRWQLGVKQPVSLRIDAVSMPVPLTQLELGVQGFYPYDAQRPLTLTKLAVNALGGEIRLTPLSLPQGTYSVLSVKSIEMSELITALKPKQFAISGRVSGELPINFDDPRGYVRHGWVANDSSMALRLDKTFADAIAGRNMATAAAINWLRYMEITHTRADLDVDRQGQLLMQAQIIGTNPQINAQREIRLNYRHQENLFQLWRSLRFGANVEQALEKQASAPANTRRVTQ